MSIAKFVLEYSNKMKFLLTTELAIIFNFPSGLLNLKEISGFPFLLISWQYVGGLLVSGVAYGFSFDCMVSVNDNDEDITSVQILINFQVHDDHS